MVDYIFGPEIAYDATSGTPARSASFTVYAAGDTSNSTPLSVTDLSGLPITLKSNGEGVVQEFIVADETQVKIVSGSHSSVLTAVKSIIERAETAAAGATAAASSASAAQLAAEAAQSQATSLASGVVRSVNGSSPDGSGNVNVSGGGGSGGSVTSVAGKTGDVSLVKGDVGLGQADNTSDADKPVSSAQAAALAGKAATAHTHSIANVSGLQAALDSKAGENDAVNASQVNAGAGTINGSKLSGVVKTVNGLDPDGAGNVNVAGGEGGDVLSVNGQTGAVVLDAADVDALPDTYTPPVTSVAGLTGDVTLNRNSVGLNEVNNTADADKPVSSLQQSALNQKADDSTVVKLTGTQTVAGTKTFSSSPIVPDASFSQAKVSGLATALAGKVGSSTIEDIQVMSKAAYDALPSTDANTLYLTTGA